MSAQLPVTIPNRVARYASVVYFLIWAAAAYSFVEDLRWPPTPQLVLDTAAIMILPVVAVRGSRSGIVVDETGVTSRTEIGTRHLPWDQVARFTPGGNLGENQITVQLTDGHTVNLQFHPWPQDTVRTLETLRATRPVEPPATEPAPGAPDLAVTDPAEAGSTRAAGRRVRARVAFVALCVLLAAFGVWTLTSPESSVGNLLGVVLIAVPVIYLVRLARHLTTGKTGSSNRPT